MPTEPQYAAAQRPAAMSDARAVENYVIHTTTVVDASKTAKGVVRLATDPASATDPVVVGDNDARLTDARTPKPHTHPASDITGTIAASQLPSATTSAPGIAQFAALGVSTAGLATLANDPRLSNSRTPTAHVHDAGDITTGTVATARLPLATSSGLGIVQLATSGASVAGRAVDSTDVRLSDARTPTAHQHSGADITSGTISASFLPSASTTASGVVIFAASGSATVGRATLANDSRLSDARTPLPHIHDGADITTGTVAVARLPAATTSTAGISLLAPSGGTTAGQVIQANDVRLSDARNPLAHVHSAADITSGTLAAARLPAPLADIRAVTVTIPAALINVVQTVTASWSTPVSSINYTAQATVSAGSGISANLRVTVVDGSKTTTSCQFQIVAISALTSGAKLEVQIIGNQT